MMPYLKVEPAGISLTFHACQRVSVEHSKATNHLRVEDGQTRDVFGKFAQMCSVLPSVLPGGVLLGKQSNVFPPVPIELTLGPQVTLFSLCLGGRIAQEGHYPQLLWRAWGFF